MLTYIGYLIVGWIMAAKVGGPLLIVWSVIFGIDLLLTIYVLIKEFRKPKKERDWGKFDRRELKRRREEEKKIHEYDVASEVWDTDIIDKYQKESKSE